MRFLETLYGSQYFEIHQKGKDGKKGRFNANLFLAALIILFLFAILMVSINFIPGFNESLARYTRSIFGRTGGRSIGKLIAIPLFALIYFIVKFSVGTEENFNRHVESFMQYPDEMKKKANKILLIPFFILGLIVFGLAFTQL